MCTRRQDQDVAFELAYWKIPYRVICSKRRVVLLGQVVEQPFFLLFAAEMLSILPGNSVLYSESAPALMALNA